MLNNCNFIGRLGNDPDMKYTADGRAIANISIACSESWKDKDGNKQERTEWVRGSAFGKLAEIMGKYLRKGSLVYISGKLNTRKWQDNDGNDRYTTEIIINEMKMLGGKQKKDGSSEPKPEPQANGAAASNDFEDDIPF